MTNSYFLWNIDFFSVNIIVFLLFLYPLLIFNQSNFPSLLQQHLLFSDDIVIDV